MQLNPDLLKFHPFSNIFVLIFPLFFALKVKFFVLCAGNKNLFHTFFHAFRVLHFFTHFHTIVHIPSHFFSYNFPHSSEFPSVPFGGLVWKKVTPYFTDTIFCGNSVGFVVHFSLTCVWFDILVDTRKKYTYSICLAMLPTHYCFAYISMFRTKGYFALHSAFRGRLWNYIQNCC